MNNSNDEPNFEDMDPNALLDEIGAGAIVMARMMNGRYGLGSASTDLALPHYLLLRTLRDVGPMRVSDVAESCGMKNSAVSMALQALEERQLISRQHDESDRRVVYVTLSDAGLARLEDAEQERRETMRRYTAMLPAEDLRTMARIMRTLIDSMAAENG
ncbi:MAG: MarR family transcriptional regulator [Coriobacteriia bacterium]|nr:MarR family transcriptional regulator [Coriobacteriia bacterium]MBN2821626.1 MarR family transcriptional regulator [Coriobacteriia bacterium]